MMTTATLTRSRGRAVGWAVTAALLLATVACTAQQAGHGIPQNAAFVAATPISSTDVLALKDVYLHSGAATADASTPDAPTPQSLSDRQVLQAALSFRIKVVFMEQLATRMGVSIPGSSADEDYAAALDQLAFQNAGLRPQDLVESAHLAKLSHLMAEKLLPHVDVTAADLNGAYMQNKAALAKSWKASTSIAFFGDQSAAEAFHTAVHHGLPFDQAATANKALKVGHLMVNPLDPNAVTLIPIVAHLATGALTEPFAVGQAVAVAHVDRRVDLPARTLLSARNELTEFVVDHKRQLFFADWFQGRFRHAAVKVDPYFGTWNAELPAVV